MGHGAGWSVLASVTRTAVLQPEDLTHRQSKSLIPQGLFSPFPSQFRGERSGPYGIDGSFLRRPVADQSAGKALLPILGCDMAGVCPTPFGAVLLHELDHARLRNAVLLGDGSIREAILSQQNNGLLQGGNLIAVSSRSIAHTLSVVEWVATRWMSSKKRRSGLHAINHAGLHRGIRRKAAANDQQEQTQGFHVRSSIQEEEASNCQASSSLTCPHSLTNHVEMNPAVPFRRLACT